MNNTPGPVEILVVVGVLAVIIGIAFAITKASTPSTPKRCNVCGNNVTPKKDFNWIVFIFLCGLCYLPIYWSKSPYCPMCNSNSFSELR